MDGYWEWLKGRLGILEIVVGGLLLITGSLVLGIAASPWWLVVTIPGGLFLVTHGIYREFYA